MPNWVKLGEMKPVEDANGRRPEVDPADGEPRELEYIEYERFNNLEWNFKEPTTSQRRILNNTIENLLRPKASSVVAAADMESFFGYLIDEYILESKHTETSATLEGKELREFMQQEFETEDVAALLTTVREQTKLAISKKKDWNLRFGSDTKSKKPD